MPGFRFETLFMQPLKIKWMSSVVAIATIGLLAQTVPAQFPAQGFRTLRIVTYNIEDDINGATTPLPGLIAPPGNPSNVQAGGVLEGIGEETLGNDPAQPLDILALEETTSNPTTVQPIVNGLNSFYNAPGMYAMSPYQATEEGGDMADGNGPNALVYNTTTLQLVASVGIGTPEGSANGVFRQPVRYEFAPAGVATNASNVFFIYVSHCKSGGNSTDQTDQNEEAQLIRNDEANSLPANARVLYTGDFNASSPEPMYLTITAATAPNGKAQGQGIDPFASNPNALAELTESDTDLRYRDDFEVMTTNVYSDAPGGLGYVLGTAHAFANNGTTPNYGSVNSGSDTALNSDLVQDGPVFISASNLYSYLTTASDHLPEVADYTIPLPVPLLSASSSLNFGITNLGAGITNSVTITNLGSGSLVLSNVVVSGANPGDFTVGGLAFPATIPAGQSNSFTVVFSPLGGGSRSASLQISDNDPNNNPFNIGLSGTGNAGPVILGSFTNLTLNAANNCAAAMIDVTGSSYVQVSDVLGNAALTITQTPAIDTPLAAGTTNQVVITVSDAGGNTAYSTNWIFAADVTAPVIVSPPMDQTNNAGTAASFTVAATACTALSYQWYFGTNVLAGQTNSTLSLASVGPADAGAYQVAVSSEGGSTNTVPASLTVIYQPPVLSGGQMLPGAGGFQLNFSGPAGQTYQVFSSTDLTLNVSQWTSIGSGTFGDTNVVFTDTSATNPAEFYLIESP
jgi:hypothetical protein